jgi:hypothetical protein
VTHTHIYMYIRLAKQSHVALSSLCVRQLSWMHDCILQNTAAVAQPMAQVNPVNASTDGAAVQTMKKAARRKADDLSVLLDEGL